MATFTPKVEELLVNLVSKNPPLYDPRIHGNRDITVRDNIWEEVGEILNIPSADCKKRWKNIRDSYSRCKRKRKRLLASAALKKNKWPLFEKLRFLDSVPSERDKSNQKCEKDVDVNNVNKIVIKKEDCNEMLTFSEGTTGLEEQGQESCKEGTSDEGTSEESPSNTDTKTKTGKKDMKRKQNDAQLSQLGYLIQKDQKKLQETKNPIKDEVDVDGIKSFCSHIGSILNKLPPILKVEAKTKIFNIMTTYELQSLQYTKGSIGFFSTSHPDSNTSNPMSTTSRTVSVASSSQPTDLSVTAE